MTTSYDVITTTTTTLRLALIHSVFKTPRVHTINPVLLFATLCHPEPTFLPTVRATSRQSKGKEEGGEAQFM